MNVRNRSLAVLALLAVGAGLAALTGCTDAQSKPLDVTYYYLPG